VVEFEHKQLATIYCNNYGKKELVMKNIKKDIEQLEIAGELLDKNSPSGARLSLFLLDNLAELTMYNFVRKEFSRNNQFAPVIPPKYSSKKKRNILKHFNDKVNFLVSDLKN